MQKCHGQRAVEFVMIYRYTIPAIPPSNNQFIGRTNFREYQRVKKQWAALINMVCRPKPSAPLDGVAVRIQYFFPTRVRHDPDNYAGKMLLDGLVGAGIIKDDSFDCITLEISGGYDKHNPRTEVEVIL